MMQSWKENDTNLSEMISHYFSVTGQKLQET